MSNGELAMGNEGGAGMMLNDYLSPQSPVPDPCSPIPIDKSVFSCLGLPWFEVEADDVQKIIHGKVISQILGNREMVAGASSYIRDTADKQAAGIFSGDSFVAMIEKINGEWKYGYVYANDG
jgi:hypothetical protein